MRKLCQYNDDPPGSVVHCIFPQFYTVHHCQPCLPPAIISESLDDKNTAAMILQWEQCRRMEQDFLLSMFQWEIIGFLKFHSIAKRGKFSVCDFQQKCSQFQIHCLHQPLVKVSENWNLFNTPYAWRIS